MKREKMIEQAYCRKRFLTMKNAEYALWVENFFERKICDDIGGKRDVTSHVLLNKIPEDMRVEACIKAKETCMIAGIEEVKWVLEKRGIEVKCGVKDGERIRKGGMIMSISGPFQELLLFERTVIDMLSRMSGIAETTSQYVKKSSIRVAATRKTFWGYLDKKAVEVGGGLSHRLGLSEAVLIKENHLETLKKCIDGSAIEASIELAWKTAKNVPAIEVEVENEAECLVAAEKFQKVKQGEKNEPVGIIMLDNFSPDQVKKAVKKLKEQELMKDILIEVSGNIHLDTISKYAKTGADVVSVGAITHSVRGADMSMRVV